MSAEEILTLLRELIGTYGYAIVLLGAALDNTGVPASGDFTLLAASFLASEGELNLVYCMALAALGAAVGDNAAYWVGRLGGRSAISRVSRLFRLRESKLKVAETYFTLHGGKTVFIGRFLPTLRSLSPLLAGVGCMSYIRFVLFNLAGVGLWAVIAGTVGYLFGTYWGCLLSTWRTIGMVGAAAALLIFTILFLRSRLTRKSN